MKNFHNFALGLAQPAALVANFCDHIEHNEFADREWVLKAGSDMRDLAVKQAKNIKLSIFTLYANRLDMIESANALFNPCLYNGKHSAMRALTWRELQCVQIDHDRYFHPDVLGMSKYDQLRHFSFHLSKLVSAFASSTDEHELINKRLPDTLLFGMKLSTVMGQRLPEEPLCL